MILRLSSLSIDGDNKSSELHEQLNHKESETELTANQELTMTTSARTQNRIVTESAKVSNIIVTAAAGFPLIKTFRGKEGEDVECFLKNVSRYIELKVSNGMYKSDMEQHMDHITLIYSHYTCRVQEYIETMDGEWEVNPMVVQDGLNCPYWRMRDTGIEDDVNPMDGPHQKPTKTFRHYIQRMQKLVGLCKGRDKMYESLTCRFCQVIHDGVNQKMLILVPGTLEQKGKICFATYMAYTQGLAGTEEEPEYGRRRSTYFDNDGYEDSDDLLDSDSDSSDDERDHRWRKGKDQKHWKSLRKLKERRNEKASEKLMDLQKMWEEKA